MKLKTLVCFALLALSAQAIDTRAEINIEGLDCQKAKALPKPASDESRRIACNIPNDLQNEVMIAESVGEKLRKHYLSGWLTSGLLTRRGILKPDPENISEWLTFENETTITTRYYTTKDGVTYRLAEADLDLKSEKAVNPKAYSPQVPATAEEIVLLNARKAAFALKMTRCTLPFDAVTLPFEDAGTKTREIHVYLISPWTTKYAPLGGHHFIRVSGDGKKVLSQSSQTLACVNTDADEMKKDEMSGLMISHLSSNAPTPIHVFLSGLYGQPIFVITTTNGISWTVLGDRISVLDRMDGKQFSDASTTKKYDIKPKKEKKDDDFF
ncbi:MAG: hypothetical protein ACREO1_12040 [Arenimonas sp.]